MISSLYIYSASGSDPFENLAREQVLLEQGPADGLILYLWQNQNTVVIGKNQNAWAECRTSLLESEGGRLARRLSGGGAVYHDLGNINYTFITSRNKAKALDYEYFTRPIIDALSQLGLDCKLSGRNDLECNGRK